MLHCLHRGHYFAVKLSALNSKSRDFGVNHGWGSPALTDEGGLGGCGTYSVSKLKLFDTATSVRPLLDVKAQCYATCNP